VRNLKLESSHSQIFVIDADNDLCIAVYKLTHGMLNWMIDNNYAKNNWVVSDYVLFKLRWGDLELPQAIADEFNIRCGRIKV